MKIQGAAREAKGEESAMWRFGLIREIFSGSTFECLI
jgi:hypothetical protein